MKEYKKNISKILIIILGFLFLTFNSASAQETSVKAIVTWQAQSYHPNGYLGKNLPTLGSPIIAAVELVDNKKPVNVSGLTIRWRQNQKLIQEGVGLKRISFNAVGQIGDQTLVRADIIYKGGVVHGSAQIPVARPKIVINAPYPGKIILGEISKFEILPYFFNIKTLGELAFSWLVNDQSSVAPADNPQLLELTVNSEVDEAVINLNASASNLNNLAESANEEIKLAVKK